MRVNGRENKLARIDLPSCDFCASLCCCPAGNKKLAVAIATLPAVGIGFFFSAMPQIAVICVSGPKTYKGIATIKTKKIN